MSPSDARNTSSPFSRNARRFPSADVAVPKNFKSIGGGGGGPGGGVYTGTTGPFGLTEAIGIGIAIGAEVIEKIFLPLPEYTSDSVTSIGPILNVGSSCAEVVPTFFAAPPTAFPAGTLLPTGFAAGAVGPVTTTGAAAAGASGVDSCE